jgi:hypothetical protein
MKGLPTQSLTRTVRIFLALVHLVPESAIIQEYPPRTFGDMKNNMKLSAQGQRAYGENGDNHVVAIGCGPAGGLPFPNDNNSNPTGSTRSSGGELDYLEEFETPMRRRLQHVPDGRACNNATNFFCWMQCLEIPNYEQAEGFVNEGYSLYCVDPGALARTGNQVSKAMEPCEGGFVHNSNCMGVWQPTAPGVVSQKVEFDVTIVEEDDVFCQGGTSMYMDGFHWMHDTTCVIYLFPRWVLSTQGRFVAACLGTIVFGALVEFVIFRRRQSMTGFSAGYYRLAVSAAFYGVQLTFGYVIMLVVMTYSIPLFLCCVLGLVSGHVLFNAQDALLKKRVKTEETGPKPASQMETYTHSNEGEDEECALDKSCRETAPSGCSNTKIETKEDDNHGVPEGCTPCCQNVL